MRFAKRGSVLLAVTLLLAIVSADAPAFEPSPQKRKGAKSAAKKGSRAKAKRASASKGGRGSRISARKSRGGRARVARRGRKARRGEKYSVREAATSAPARTSTAGISAERVTEIQEALIKAGFMGGPATGQYDEETVNAMKQFQSSHKLQATGLPSAHSLKKLGVSKRSNDGYAVSVKSVSETGKNP